MKITKSTLKTVGLLCTMGLLPAGAMAQSFNATGTVTDANGEPIPGASIRVKGTTQGIMTDVDGNFAIKCEKGQTLIVSFVGYENQVVEANSHLNIEMQEDRKMLDDVVVIGYGTQRREAVTGSVANVSADKLMENPSSNVTQALQNRIAGVDMQQTNSQPGAEMRIRIRGQRSLTASNDPLIVLDGIPFMGTLSEINPSDIKAMDILKDASSTAIYGSRGANGVIMITTNKGMQGAPAKVTYNGYVGFKTLFARFPMMEGDKYAKMRDYAGKFSDGVDEERGRNTDWQDMLYQTGISHSHDVTVNGGTNTGSYSFGAGYLHDEGVIPTQMFNRLSLRANIDQKVGKYARFGISSTNSINYTEGSQLGVYSALQMTPLVNPYNTDGSLKRVVHMPSDDAYVVTKDVIEDNEDNWMSHKKTIGTYNNLFAEITNPWIEGLSYRMNLGLNYRGSKNGNYTGTGVNNVNANEKNSASQTREDYQNWAIEHLLTYDFTIADKHNFNIVAMYSAEQTKYSKINMSGRDIANGENFQYFNIGAARSDLKVDPNNQNYWQAGLESFMGRIMYDYDGKYMASVALRKDGSSRLASGHKWHTYPAVSAGWNISKESFMEDLDMIDNLKLRVGYGETSNQAINPYSTHGQLGTVNYNFGSTYATGYSPYKLGNTDLGWEYSQNWNYGIDFTLFNGRLNGTIEYYTQKTKDILLDVTLPGSGGVSSFTGNVGETENKGFEFTVNGTIIDNMNGWTWEAGLNLAANHNKLTKLSGADTRDANGNKIPEKDEANHWFVGHPIDVIFDYEYDGLWNEGDKDYEYLQTLVPGGNEGMIKVKYDIERDANGKPTRAIGPEDRRIIDLEPALIGGFNTRVAWKNIDLNIIGAFQFGGKIVSTLYSSTGYLNMLSGRRGNVDVDYWTENNKGAKYPKPGGIQDGDNPKYGSTLGVFDGGYCKIRNITLGYNFDRKLLKNIGITSLRVYGTIQNPFVISSDYYDESGMDPEPNSMSKDSQFHATTMGGHSIPVVGTNAPATRNYLIGLNVTF
ncbi:MAG: TonB-dependent receptor [Bacteroidales bacterium]|nr:TonB-dependent receptor [Bacteroidales bacterium]